MEADPPSAAAPRRLVWEAHGRNVEVRSEGTMAIRVEAEGVSGDDASGAIRSEDDAANVAGSSLFADGVHVFCVRSVPRREPDGAVVPAVSCWAGVVNAASPKVDMTARRSASFWVLGALGGELHIGDNAFMGAQHRCRLFPEMGSDRIAMVRVRVDMVARTLAFSLGPGAPWVDAGVTLPEKVRPLARLYGHVGGALCRGSSPRTLRACARPQSPP